MRLADGHFVGIPPGQYRDDHREDAPHVTKLISGEAVVSLGTGKAPSRTFEEKNEEAKMRPEVIEEVIKRTFGNSKAKTNGTGIWLRIVSKIF